MLVRIADFISDMILMPGDLICRLFKLSNPEQHALLRIYINLFIYAKIAILWVFWYLSF
jgi:hypothetical protein